MMMRMRRLLEDQVGSKGMVVVSATVAAIQNGQCNIDLSPTVKDEMQMMII